MFLEVSSIFFCSSMLSTSGDGVASVGIWIPFGAFSYMIVVAKISNKSLIQVKESAFHIEYDVRCGLLIYSLYYLEICSL